MRRASSLQPITVLLLLLGCDGGDDGVPPMDQPIPIDEICAEIAAADCARLVECGALPPPLDQTACRLRQEHVVCGPVVGAFQASVDEGALTYFELAARDCRDAVAAQPCTVGVDYDLLEIEACRGMVAGAAEEGDPCHVALACPDGLFCDAGGECPGTCRTYAGNNEPCGLGMAPCAPDLFCSVTGMRCRARIDLAGACELSLDNNPCRDGGFCDRAQPGAERCVPVRGRKQGCNSSFECIEGARCIRNACSAGLDGDACEVEADCAPGFSCFGGKCTVPLELEVACTMDGPPCREGLVCTSSVGRVACHPRPTAGENCTGDCYLSRCVRGVCAPLVLPEEACGASAECLPSHTCEESVCKVEPISCSE